MRGIELQNEQLLIERCGKWLLFCLLFNHSDLLKISPHFDQCLCIFNGISMEDFPILQAAFVCAARIFKPNNHHSSGLQHIHLSRAMALSMHSAIFRLYYHQSTTDVECLLDISTSHITITHDDSFYFYSRYTTKFMKLKKRL